jgi:anti-anti-sigma factor
MYVFRLPDDDTTPNDPNVAEPAITIVVEHGRDTTVLKIAGELELASCASVTRACVGGHARTVVVDLADLTFLDCGGYRAFVAARTELEEQHRTLELVGAVGEPRRLLDLIQHLEASSAPVR